MNSKLSFLETFRQSWEGDRNRERNQIRKIHVNSGIDQDAGDDRGALIDLDQIEGKMNNASVFPFPAKVVLTALLRGVYDMSTRYPGVITRFLDVFEQRSTTPGYPEFVLGAASLNTVIESLIKDEPSARSVEFAKALVPDGDSGSERKQGAERNQDYVIRCLGVLSRLYLMDSPAIKALTANLDREPEDMMIHVLALHLTYIYQEIYAPF